MVMLSPWAVMERVARNAEFKTTTSTKLAKITNDIFELEAKRKIALRDLRVPSHSAQKPK
jgi:hypothetical protein